MAKMPRRKLENINAPYAFKVSNDVYKKNIRYTDGKNALVEKYGFNNNTAGDLINDFRYLMDGESFERTLNAFYSNYFLQNIYEMYGIDRLKKATLSLSLHIEYYEGHYRTKLWKLREVLEFYKKICSDGHESKLEQEIVEREIKNVSHLSKRELFERIKVLEKSDIELIEIKGLKYKRNNFIIGLIKEFRDHKCQICGIRIQRKDGSFYIEAAHIKAKHLEGAETLDNIILLCPNHHKEFDLGATEISNNLGVLSIKMNGIDYSIQMEKTDKDQVVNA